MSGVKFDSIEVLSTLGINTSGPTHQFHIKGPASAYAAMRIESASASHGAILNMGDSTDDDYGQIVQFASSAGEGGRMRFIAGTTETMNLRGGNVGIGTSSPTTKLHLGGTAPLDSIIRQDSTTSGTNWEIGEREAGKWQIFEDDGDSIVATFMSTGKVGIGTTSPQQKLVVSDGGGYGFEFAPNFSSVNQILSYDRSADAYRDFKISANQIILGYGQAAANEAMRINSSGNVGIGGTPTHQLHLISNIPTIKMTESDAGTDAFIQSSGGNLNFFADDGNADADTSMGFFVDNSEAMRINSDGALLIGRTTALQSDNMLSVQGSGTGAGNAIMDVRNTASSDTCGCIALSKASTTTDSSARFIWFFANNFSTSMGAIGGNGASNVQFVTASDERLKENIQPITGSLDKVLALNPVSYTWKENGEHIKAGFVAQEVEKVLPEYTDTEDDEMKTKSLTGGMTAGYIAVLTKAIQEQQAQIEALQSEINILKGE